MGQISIFDTVNQREKNTISALSLSKPNAMIAAQNKNSNATLLGLAWPALCFVCWHLTTLSLFL